jgi:nicotinamide riboside kinase
MTVRVVIVGAESTGTTTLTTALCDHYRQRGGKFANTQWVREFGRDMSFIKLDRLRTSGLDGTMEDLVWTDEDFVEIAREQNRLEDEAALVTGPLLLCDTDAWATVIWQQRYMGHRTPDVVALAQHAPRALYILTNDLGVDFEADEIRDGEHLRAEMTNQFREALGQQPTPWIELDGYNVDERLQRAVAAIDDVLGL